MFFVFVHHALGENQSLFSIYIYINDFSVTLHMFAKKRILFLNEETKKHFCYVMMCSVKYSLLCRVECIFFFLGGGGSSKV